MTLPLGTLGDEWLFRLNCNSGHMENEVLQPEGKAVKAALGGARTLPPILLNVTLITSFLPPELLFPPEAKTNNPFHLLGVF